MKQFLTKYFRQSLIGVFILSIFLAGCGGTPEETLTPEDVLSNAHGTMSGLDGFHFLIAVDGADVYLDQNQTIVFTQADGDYVPPESVYADIKVVFSGIIAEVSIINIGDAKWETNPLTGAWSETTNAYAFQPLELLDPDTGIFAILAEDSTQLTMETGAALDELPGQELILISGSLSGTRIHQLSYSLIDDEALEISVWVAPDSYEIHRLEITDPGEVNTVWTMDFWNFGNPADIQPPQ